MPFRTSPIKCDENAPFWSEKGTALILKMRNEYNLKGFMGFKDGNGYRISDMASSIEEAKNDFLVNRENLIKVFGVIIPADRNDPEYQKKTEEYWKDLVEKIEKS
jgi:hypothetical protein